MQGKGLGCYSDRLSAGATADVSEARSGKLRKFDLTFSCWSPLSCQEDECCSFCLGGLGSPRDFGKTAPFQADFTFIRIG